MDEVGLRIEPAGWCVRIASDEPILAGARAAGIVLPSSCRNGTCRACLCELVGGEIAYRIEWPGVSADEKRDGWILPCVAHAVPMWWSGRPGPSTSRRPQTARPELVEGFFDRLGTGFDRLSPNGRFLPLALSLSKGSSTGSGQASTGSARTVGSSRSP